MNVPHNNLLCSLLLQCSTIHPALPSVVRSSNRSTGRRRSVCWIELVRLHLLFSLSAFVRHVDVALTRQPAAGHGSPCTHLFLPPPNLTSQPPTVSRTTSIAYCVHCKCTGYPSLVSTACLLTLRTYIGLCCQLLSLVGLSRHISTSSTLSQGQPSTRAHDNTTRLFSFSLYRPHTFL